MQYNTNNKFIGKGGGEVHSNIYDSNDFDRIVGEINQNQMNYQEKKENSTTHVMSSINSKKEYTKSKTEEREEESKKKEKQMNHRKMHNQNDRNEKRKPMSIDDISVFPHATSLVQTAESNETYIPSNSIKSAKLIKTKKSNSLKKFDDSYNIDAYEHITNSFTDKREKKHEKSKRKSERERETHKKNSNTQNMPAKKGNQKNADSNHRNQSYKLVNTSKEHITEEEKDEEENKKLRRNEKKNKQMNVTGNEYYNYEESNYDNHTEPNENKSIESGYKRNKHEHSKQKEISEIDKHNEHSEYSDSSIVNSSINQRKQTKNKSKNSNLAKEKNNNTDNEKEENYLRSPFVLSIESLDETEKDYEEAKYKKGTKVKDAKKKEIQQEHEKNESEENNKELTITESYEPVQGTSCSISSDHQHPLQKKNSSRKNKIAIKEKESIEPSVKNGDCRSNATTNDSDYSFNEQMNISYENFKLYNKNKMYYIINQEKKKNELLDALNTKQTLQLRKILRIMREFYIGFIGIQLIYFITTILMGMSNIYLIQVFSLSCTIFSILDANYHGYLLNGFINFSISILFTLACTQAISGFEDLKNNITLRNIAISNVVLLFLFSILSFVNGFYIYKLHSTEKRCIKQVVKTIEESTTQTTEQIIP